jgi:voltage-gated potassium channel
MPQTTPATKRKVLSQRGKLVRQVAATLDRPMTVLSFVWLVLMIVDLTAGLSPLLQQFSDFLWGLFILHFVLEFMIAPSKWAYLRANWLTALALALPAVRVLRVFRTLRFLRAARATRSLSLLRVLTSLNRGIGATRRSLRRRGFGYVLAVTAVVTFGGAAGMYAFERPAALYDAGLDDFANRGGGLHSYAESLWWTAMLMTTMGTDYSPKTPEGRILTLLLAVYAFAIFGYITAVIASYFIGQDRKTPPAPAAPTGAELAAEVRALRRELAAALDGQRGAARAEVGSS